MHRATLIPFFYFTSLIVISMVCFQITSETISPLSSMQIPDSNEIKESYKNTPSKAFDGEEEVCSAKLYFTLDLKETVEVDESNQSCNISFGVAVLVSVIFNGIYNSKKFMMIGTI